MFKAVLIFLLFFGTAAGLAYTGGIRFHPEALESYYNKSAVPQVKIKKGAAPTHKIQFNHGGTLDATIVDEDEKSVTVQMDSGTVDFLKAEIAGITKKAATPAAVSAEKQAKTPGSAKQPLFSYEKKNNAFLAVLELIDVINPATKAQQQLVTKKQAQHQIASAQTARGAFDTARKKLPG